MKHGFLARSGQSCCLLLFTALMITSCQSNPFLQEWDTPYGMPPFGQIKESHYLPAVKAGIAQLEKEVVDIIVNPEAPSFDNVVGAYDQAGEILAKVQGVLFNLVNADGTPRLRAIAEQALPLMTDVSSRIFTNPGLFQKVEALYKVRDTLHLTSEQLRYLEDMYRRFEENGIALDEAGQQRMREINVALASREMQFGSQLLAENNEFKAKYGVAVSEYVPAMTTCADRERRREMFEGYSSRGNHGNANDNKELIKEIMSLRIEQAQLLGYDCPANFILSDKMAHDAPTVDKFLEGIFKAAVAKAKEEVKDLQAEMDKDIAAGLLPEGSRIEPWDWFYYAERVRMVKFNLTEDQVRPYFQMENVRQGVFDNASRLYGIRFEPVPDAPKYHPEVEVFKVMDADGSLLGIFSTDYFPRDTKRGGAWMNNMRDQYFDRDGNEVRPIIVNVGNFTRPTADAPALLSLDDVETMFHEFGHALHGLLSQCRYRGTSGTAVARDFVELPSQINENWAFQKEVLATYARHYQTGEVIPAELVDRIVAADKFNQGFMTTELCAASILDMKWHELTKVDGLDPLAFEEQVCREMGLIGEIIPRYRSTYFNHIFNTGYSAGYYSYLWAEVLDKDAFELFLQRGIYDAETAASFRRNVLEKGNSDDPMTLYRAFRGADPDAGALLRARGL